MGNETEKGARFTDTERSLSVAKTSDDGTKIHHNKYISSWMAKSKQTRANENVKGKQQEISRQCWMVEEKKSFALMMAIDVDDVHKLEHTTHTHLIIRLSLIYFIRRFTFRSISSDFVVVCTLVHTTF